MNIKCICKEGDIAYGTTGLKPNEVHTGMCWMSNFVTLSEEFVAMRKDRDRFQDNFEEVINDTDKRRKLYDRAMALWGEPAQIGMFIEESAEGIHAACKIIRGSGGKMEDAYRHFAEEIADVQIMSEQMENMLDKSTMTIEWVQQARDKKLQRLLEKVEQHEQKKEEWLEEMRQQGVNIVIPEEEDPDESVK